VEVEPTQEDVAVFRDFVDPKLIDQSSFDAEVRTIREIQGKVIRTIVFEPRDRYGESHEPKHVLSLRLGQCFDRARAIEKFLRIVGFETRHVSIYDTEGRSSLNLLYKSHLPSHALTEVRTSRGWMAVGTGFEWVGLLKNSQPVSVKDMAKGNLPDGFVPRDEFGEMLPGRFHVIYGLYSRHGKFFPPYIFFPDINFRELLYNLTS
jgi:hypothetical protein